MLLCALLIAVAFFKTTRALRSACVELEPHMKCFFASQAPLFGAATLAATSTSDSMVVEMDQLDVSDTSSSSSTAAAPPVSSSTNAGGGGEQVPFIALSHTVVLQSLFRTGVSLDNAHIAATMYAGSARMRLAPLLPGTICYSLVLAWALASVIVYAVAAFIAVCFIVPSVGAWAKGVALAYFTASVVPWIIRRLIM
jgi:hypothetical protein